MKECPCDCRVRWLAVALVVGAAVAGTIGTINLRQPPTSEPPLFEHEHNVQFFWRYQNSEEADNVPVCFSCARPLTDAFADPVGFAANPAGYLGADPDKPIVETATVCPRFVTLCRHQSFGHTRPQLNAGRGGCGSRMWQTLPRPAPARNLYARMIEARSLCCGLPAARGPCYWGR